MKLQSCTYVHIKCVCTRSPNKNHLTYRYHSIQWWRQFVRKLPKFVMTSPVTCDVPMSHINCMYVVWQLVIDMQTQQKTVLTGLQTQSSHCRNSMIHVHKTHHLFLNYLIRDFPSKFTLSVLNVWTSLICTHHHLLFTISVFWIFIRWIFASFVAFLTRFLCG